MHRTWPSVPHRYVATRAHQQAYDRRWWTLGVLCLSLLIVFIGQLEPQRRAALAVARPRRHRVAAPVGRRRRTRSCSPGCCSPPARSATASDARARSSSGWRRSSWRPRSASQATEMWQIIGCRAVMGVGAAFIMPSTLSILVNVFPAGRTGQGDRDLGRHHRRRRRRSVRSSSGFLLTHFWFGSVFLINLPIIAVAFIGGWFLVPKSKDPERGALDPVGALLSIVGHLVARVRAHPGTRQGLGSRRRRSARSRIAAVVLTALRAVGVAHRRADARHALLPQPELQHRQRRHAARVPRDVRRHVPDDAVLPARARLLAAVGGGPLAPDGADHDHRRAAALRG